MLHEPASPATKDPSGPYKIRLGVIMFLVYLLFYAIFVAINLLFPKSMAMILFGGLNLVTIYGFALIIVALIEALIYDFLCRKKEAFYKTQNESQEKE